MATGRVPTTANSPLTAKGDLFGYSTTQARVPVGNDGETLVADSSATTGLRWQGNFAAGKNKIINGDFGIWQRGTSITLPSSFAYTYTADRFECFSIGAGASVSRQSFTPGTAPVAGYEGQFFLRYVNPDTSVGHIVRQKIEDVRTFAGQTVTLSFWAKANTNVSFSAYNKAVQNFGSGGSADAQVAYTYQSSTVTTSWQRFTTTFTLPSISGKTVGSSSFLMLEIGCAGNATLDLWGVQLEAGNTATAFQTATGTLAGELAACQRYFYQLTGANGSGGTSEPLGLGTYYNASIFRIPMRFPVAMRTAPAVTASNVANYFSLIGNGVSLGYPTVTLDIATTNSVILNIATTGGTTGQAAWVQTANAASFVSFSAEL